MFEAEISKLKPRDQDLWAGRSDGRWVRGEPGCASSPGQGERAWLGGENRSKPWRQGCGRDKTEASPEGEETLAKVGERW